MSAAFSIWLRRDLSASHFGRRKQPLDAIAELPQRSIMASREPATEAERTALVRAVADSEDRNAFITLFEFYAPRIKAQAMRFGVAADVAEDIAQDAMLLVWRSARQFDPQRGSASAWIFTIATNARLGRMRRDRRLALAVELDGEMPELAVQSPEGNDAARLSRCVQSLPEEQRRILRLSFFSDLPHGEIASRLGIPLGTVKSRIRLAIAKLRHVLRDEA